MLCGVGVVGGVAGGVVSGGVVRRKFSWVVKYIQ